MKKNKIYNQDCIEGMKNLKDISTDLIIADPPYNLSKGKKWEIDKNRKLKGMGGQWNNMMEK